MRTLLGTILLAGTAMAADQDFNGRWDITAQTKPRARGWWLELSGVGGPQAAGKFVSAIGGDMNVVNNLTLQDGEIRFNFQNSARSAPTPIYHARLVNGKLEGAVDSPDGKTPPIPWTGVRAPEIAEKDDGSWKEGKPIHLFNGKDLHGWKALNPDAEMKWTVKDGILRNAPPTTDIISEQKFWNFLLHVDFRIVEHSNSGIGLRGRYEIQILEDFGKPPGTHSAGSLYSRVAPSVNASRPPGEWQTYDIRLVGRTLTVAHNGKTVIDKAQVEGLTAIANNSDESEPGPFIVQGDHSYIEIKSFVVTPLTKKK